jgi:hypothetical protein
LLFVGLVMARILPTAVVFDVGNVLVDWNVRAFYAPLIPDPAASLLATLHATVQIAPMVSLRGGTREILRGIIARGLGVR